MSSALRRLFRDIGFFILALLLATAIWIAATLQADPFTVQEFPNVPITLQGQPGGTVLFEPISERVTIAARAPETVLSNLKASDFEATMDLSAVEPGVPATVPIEVTSKNEAVRIMAWDPTAQVVHLEAIQTITLPTTIEIQGQVATGYQTTGVQVEPGQVSVYGPEPLLAEVTSVVGALDVTGARETFSEEVRVRPQDADGDLVPGLEWTPDRVDVQVDIRRRLGFKPDVEVVPDLRGELVQGYRLGSVSVDPSTVTLAGVPSVLEELPGFVETWPISVTSATQDLSARTPLRVPDNVVVVGVDFVTVTVEVLPIQSSRTMTSSVEIRGVGSGWVATPSPNVVEVILEGPDAVLSQMKPSDLRVILDLLDFGLGVHRVRPEVLAPEGIDVVSIIPETIEVAIETAPPPTRTPTASPAP